MYCPNCGQPIPEHSNFCSKCGKHVESDIQGTFATSNPNTNNSNSCGQSIVPEWLPIASGISILFFLPLGVASMVQCNQAKKALATGNIPLATESSAKAKKFMKWAYIVGTIACLLTAVAD